MIKCFISFSAILALTLFLEAVMAGRIFSDFYKKSPFFDSDKANAHHKFLTNGIRVVGTPHYEKSYKYIYEELQQMSTNINNPFISVNVSLDISDVAQEPFVVLHQLQRNVVNILMTLTPKTNNLQEAENLPVLYISAHYDSHTVGVGAYDNAISATGMIEVIRAVILSNCSIHAKFVFVFIGSEEFGLHGSARLTEECKILAPNSKTFYLNLEGMGGSRPYGLLTKAPLASSVVRAFSKVKGALLASFGGDIMKTGVMKAGSDSASFQKCNISGGEVAFLGNPSSYHTAMDLVGDPKDISVMGNTIVNTLLNFKADEDEESNLIAIGIVPFCIVINIEILKMTIVALALISIVEIIQRSNFMKLLIQFLKFIGVSLLSLALAFGYAGGQYYFNSLSYAPYPRMSLISISIALSSAFIAYLFLFNEFDPISYSSIQLLVDSVLAILLRNTDFSIFFAASLFVGIVRSLLLNKLLEKDTVINFVFSLLLSSIGFAPTSILCNIVYRTLLGYTTMLPNFFGEAFPYVFVWFFVWRIMLTILPILTNSTNIIHPKKINSLFLLSISFFIFIYHIFILPPPYSDTYLIKGTAGEYLYSNGSANVHFIPEAGLRIVNFLNKSQHGGTLVNNFHRTLLKAPGFVKNITRSSFVDKWPKYGFKEINRTEKSRSVRFWIENKGADAAALVIKCKNEACVQSIEKFKKIEHKVTVESNFTVGFRVAKLPKTEFSIDIVLTSLEPIPCDVLFTFYEKSKERTDFMNSFPSYVKEFGKERYLADTQLVNMSYI